MIPNFQNMQFNSHWKSSGIDTERFAPTNSESDY